MADTFDIGDTVICSIEVTDDSDNLQNPATSMSIEVFLARNNAVLQASTSMGNDGTGLYHKDIATSGAESGKHIVKYTAVDGTRITIHRVEMLLE